MSYNRNTRRILTVLLGGILLTAAMSSQALAAGGYGELFRFRGKGTNKSGNEFEFGGTETPAFAADPEDGSIYVGDEKLKEEVVVGLRIQKYSSSGSYEAEGLIKEPAILPKGAPGFAGWEGFAIDPTEKRIYTLALYKRFAEDKVDPSKEVAGALYALKTNATSGKLEPAEDAGKEGLLGTTESLGAASETPGQALLSPSGITVDPATGEVLILGLVNQGAAGLHTAVEHVSSTGAVLDTYVDPEEVTRANEPDSPVVSSKGKLFFEQGNELLELPADATTGLPVAVFQFSEPQSLAIGPFAEELMSFGEGETGAGGGLAIISEGSPTEGRIVSFAEIHEMTDTGELGEERNGALDVHYSEEGEHVKVSELGWTGGVPGEGEEEANEKKEKVKPCEIGFAASNPHVAATGGGSLLVLAPAWSEVIDFGLGGSGCPTAHEAPTGLEVTLDKRPVTNPEVGNRVTLSAKIIQGSVLSTKWVFDDGQEATVETPAGEQTQTAAVEHAFAKTGTLNVEATIHTDDLATPEIKVKGTVNVVEHHEEKQPPPGEEPKGEQPGNGGGGNQQPGTGGTGGGGGPSSQGQEPAKSGPTGEVSAAKESSPRAILATTSLGVSRSGAVAVKVSCPPGVTRCTGTVTLRTLTAVSARAHARGAAKKVLTLAAGTFALAGGQVKAVTLHLSSQARALLARSHVLRARATVSAHDPAGGSSTVTTTVTLRPAKASSHH